MVYTYNRVLFILTRVGNSDICHSMNEPEGQYIIEIRQTQKERFGMAGVGRKELGKMGKDM